MPDETTQHDERAALVASVVNSETRATDHNDPGREGEPGPLSFLSTAAASAAEAAGLVEAPGWDADTAARVVSLCDTALGLLAHAAVLFADDATALPNTETEEEEHGAVHAAGVGLVALGWDLADADRDGRLFVRSPGGAVVLLDDAGWPHRDDAPTEAPGV